MDDRPAARPNGCGCWRWSPLAALWRLRHRLGRGGGGVVFFAVTLAPVLSFISFYYSRIPSRRSLPVCAQHRLNRAATASWRLVEREARVAAGLGVASFSARLATWRRLTAFGTRRLCGWSLVEDPRFLFGSQQSRVRTHESREDREATGISNKRYGSSLPTTRLTAIWGWPFGRRAETMKPSGTAGGDAPRSDFRGSTSHLGRILEKRGDLASAASN